MCIRDSLLCVEWDVKPYTLTHSHYEKREDEKCKTGIWEETESASPDGGADNAELNVHGHYYSVD